jgi:DNA polymerase-3 subunit gamma/tau
LALFRDLVVAKVCSEPKDLLDVSDVERSAIQKLAEATDADDLIRLHQGFATGFDSIVRSGQPRAALEMLLVRLARRPPLIPIDDLIARLALLERRLGGGGDASGKSGPPGPRPSERPRGGAPLGQAGATPERTAAPVAANGTNGRNGAIRAESKSTSELRVSEVALALKETDDVPAEVRADPLLSAWRALLSVLQAERPELAAFLTHALPLEVSATTIIVGWPPNSFFADQVSDASAIEAIMNAAERRFGARPSIRFESNREPSPGTKTLAEIYVAERQQKTQAALEDARNHPAVREAMDVLGAKLKDVRLRPD